MLYNQEIATLDAYINQVINEYPVVGITEEALRKVRASGYSTPYYYIHTYGDSFDELFSFYMQNPKVEIDELQNKFNNLKYPTEAITYTIYLYMKEESSKPDKAIFNKIVEGLENMEGIPKGSYSVILNDNLIDKVTSIGIKDNSLERSDPDPIIIK
ncbi:hypothetical protein J2S19_005034 [Metabacillus malikii]|uniref:Uncharacterized protein n=1 Tax=Metabacillus malikii TaxID=1504265 RepID=A0ABT9ZPJ0_9BACI|nr:hypothetical protein [Metabacillus malikii]